MEIGVWGLGIRDLRFGYTPPQGLRFRVYRVYRGTSLIRKRTPPRTVIGPYAYAYCRGVAFSDERGNPVGYTPPQGSGFWSVGCRV